MKDTIRFSFLFVITSLMFNTLAIAQDAPVAEPSAQEAREESADEATQEKQAADETKKDDRAKRSAIEHFMRIRRDRRGRAVAMQTSVTRYQKKMDDGEIVSVDLIGVVHIGEKDYYDKLNEAFESYDKLLYELVAPEGTVIPKGGRGNDVGMNPIAMMQVGIKETLGLEFQLDHIDYTKDNFVHADMTPEEFVESMNKNNESISRIFLKAMGQSMAMQSSGGGTEVKMLMAMFSKNREYRMRRIFADQMREMEGGMAMFEGDEGSTIIDYRNKKCMDILRREIDGGQRKLAIFYGAGHLVDMERRLESSFQMQRAGQYWLDAWALRNTEKK